MAALIALALILGLPVIPRRWRVCLLLPLAVFQIYPPWLVVGQLPVPLALIVTYAFWPELLREAKFLLAVKPIRLLLGVMVVMIISFLWSVNVRLGLVSLNNLLSFIVVFAGVASQARSNYRWIVHGLTMMYFASIALAASVIAFRFAPTEKLIFLQTKVATWFISSNTLTELFQDGSNNVFDPDKSGGFAFVNGNGASTFLGVVAMVALGTGRAYRKPLHIVMGMLLLAAVPFAGSKAGLLLTFPALALFLVARIAKKERGAVVLLGLQAALIAVLVIKIVGLTGSGASGPSLGGQISDTADTRLQVWSFALQMFIQSPILGQGFGGWQVTFPSYARFAGVPTDLPPHNTFIYLWSQSGLIATIFALGFVMHILKRSFSYMTISDAELSGLGAMMALGYGWLLFQGFGENEGLIGDVHMQPVLAAALALFTVRVTARTERIQSGYA